MLKLIVSVFVFLSSYQTFASCGILTSECSCGVRADSYAYGLKTGLTGTGELPAGLNDEICFNYGLIDGKKVSDENERNCSREFEKAFAQGSKGEAQSGSLTMCHNIGYNYGASYLRVSARNGDDQAVSQACIDAYERGERSSQNGSAPVLGLNNYLDACYMAGYYDSGYYDLED